MSSLDLEGWEQTKKSFDYNSMKVAYWEKGKGPVLLCIHGFPTASWDWYKIWPTLTKNFRSIAADMIGFGLTDKPHEHEYSLMEQADMLEALIAKRGIKRFHILAHDYGNSVAQELLARFHERGGKKPEILSTCLLNGGLFPETHHPLLIQKLLLSPIGGLISRFMSKGKLASNFKRIFGPSTQPSQKEIDTFWNLMNHKDGNRIFHKLIRYMPERAKNRERWVGALQRSTVPIRLIDGLVDPISGAHMVKRYRELIPKPDVIELGTIGHYPQVEAPEATLRAILSFHTGLKKRGQ